MTNTVTTYTIPADAQLFALPAEVATDYPVGLSFLVRVDSRATRGGYVHSYAAITARDGVEVVDASSCFEDSFGEVQPYR